MPSSTRKSGATWSTSYVTLWIAESQSPLERTAAGKPERGSIRIRAEEGTGGLWIRFHDDGRGIDWSRIKSRGQALGLRHQSQQDLVELLFCDGMSTREFATDFSGRGMGLSAVKAACLASGATSVSSTLGHGTEFCIQVPDAAGTVRQAA
jgi:chemotaxis protein histidine kinase CheA